MTRIITSLFALLLLTSSALAGGHGYLTMYPRYNRAARWFNANVPWHAPYAHATWKQPIALIAPPVANMQTSYGWGVARTRMTPIYHQFTRPYVAPGGAGGGLSAAPSWPSSTQHQGVNYVRGPW